MEAGPQLLTRYFLDGNSMRTSLAKASPQLEARIAGGLWLIVIAAGLSGFVIWSRLVVRGDAAATATNIMASETLFRLGFTADLVAGACYMGVTVILYQLLKPVSRTLSLLGAFCGLAGITIGAVSAVHHLAPVMLLGGGEYLTAFTASQVQAQALISLRLHGQGYTIGSMYFGFQCILIGFLIGRSAFLPRILGVLLAIGGSTYVISSFATFLSPAVAAQISSYIVAAGLIGEGSLCLWLIVKGVNLRSWEEQAAARIA